MEDEVIIQAYSWHLQEIANKVNILAWGLDKDSKPHLVRIPYFYSCYLELKPLIKGRQREVWKYRYSAFISRLRELLRDCSFVYSEYLEASKLYYYQGDKKNPMIKLSFHSIEGIETLRKLVRKPIEFGSSERMLRASVSLLEDRHSPIRRFLTEVDCKYAQWFSIKVEKPKYNISKLDNEWVGDYQTLVPLQETIVTKPKIFSFDIECYSTNHKGFPKEYIVEHVVYMISCIVFRAGSKEREKYLIVLSPKEDIEIEGVEVTNTKTEVELCQAFSDLVNEIDPDMITGFNIFGFDYPYLHQRLGLRGREWDNITRLEDGTNDLIEINWKSSAYSRQRYFMMKANGRINFDLYTLARREMKLSKYNLDTVAKTCLGRGKHDISALEMFSIYQNFSANPSKYKGDFIRVAEYCLEDAMLVADLIEKLNVWIWLIEFSSVTGVSVEDLFIRGQQVRCYSLLQDLAMKRGVIVDKGITPKGKYSGAYISDPIPGLHEFVVCLDFNSLYPNIMRAYNMCYTTIIRPEEEEEIPETDKHVIEWEEEGGVIRHCFIKQEKKEGILPQLLTELISRRKEVRESMKEDKDPLSLSVKDKKQLALKVVANSSYGFTGASSKGILPCLQIAESVTARGRELILQCNAHLEERGYTCLYNDTDSVFFIIKPEKEGTFEEQYKEVLEKGKKLEKELSAIFPDVLNLEMEKVGRMFCIKKKMYSFWPVNREGKLESQSKILHKGIVLSRRDNCPWQKEFFHNVLMCCLESKAIEEIYSLICQEVIDLYSRKYSWQEFNIIKSVGEEYKLPTAAMNIFSQKMASRSCPISSGDRVDYIIVETGIEDDYLGNKMLSPEHFLLDNAKVDYDYYLEHYGIKSIQNLFKTAFKEELQRREEEHKEIAAKNALNEFILRYPQYEPLCVVADKWTDMHAYLFISLQQRRIGRHRHELRKMYRNRLKLNYICSQPVKQQYELIKLKRETVNQIKFKDYKLRKVNR